MVKISWPKAVSMWNKMQAFHEELYGIPKRGSEGYDEVKEIMGVKPQPVKKRGGEGTPATPPPPPKLESPEKPKEEPKMEKKTKEELQRELRTTMVNGMVVDLKRYEKISKQLEDLETEETGNLTATQQYERFLEKVANGYEPTDEEVSIIILDRPNEIDTLLRQYFNVAANIKELQNRYKDPIMFQNWRKRNPRDYVANFSYKKKLDNLFEARLNEKGKALLKKALESDEYDPSKLTGFGGDTKLYEKRVKKLAKDLEKQSK